MVAAGPDAAAGAAGRCSGGARSGPRSRGSSPAPRPVTRRGWTARSGALVRRRPRAAGGRLRSRSSSPARSATSAGAATSTLTEQYRDPPESVQGQQLIARALPARAASRRSTCVVGAGAALARQGRARRSDRVVADADTDSQSDGRQADLAARCCSKIDPFSAQAMDVIPRAARGGARGRRRRDGAGRRHHRRATRQPARRCAATRS